MQQGPSYVQSTWKCALLGFLEKVGVKEGSQRCSGRELQAQGRKYSPFDIIKTIIKTLIIEPYAFSTL